MKNFKKIFKPAFIVSIPVLTGYMCLGFGFGVMLASKGYGIFEAFIMCLTIFSGSMQYVAVGMLAGGASLFTVAITTLLVNERYLFYGISMLDKFKHIGPRKYYLILGLTDETYSILCSENPDVPSELKKDYYLLVAMLNHSYWITGGVLGATVGSLVSFNSEGIDFVLTALFITVFIEQWFSTKNHNPAVIGVLVSVICLLIFGSEYFLIPTMIIIVALLCIDKNKEASTNDN